MLGNIFTVLIVQPIFNILVLIYGLLPGHNFGIAIILFTILVRLALWPLLKKQLHQSIKMRALQPELKKIKAKAKNRQQESMLMMELYKERGISPFSSIGVMLLQLPILLALYACLQRIIKDPAELVNFAYPALQHLPSIQDLAGNIHLFDNTLFGLVDLSRSALSAGGIYWPAMIIVAASAVVQFYQSKQLMPVDKDARKLRVIMKEASATGKQADQAEISAAMSKTMIYLLPGIVFLFGMQFPSALGLYWLVSSAVALIQQTIILRRDSEELIASVTTAHTTKSNVTIKKGGKKVVTNVEAIPEAEVISETATPAPKKSKQKPKSKKGNVKRRKK